MELPSQSNATGMLIDGIACSEAIDTSGEVLDVAGSDISDVEAGLATLNWEHRDDESQGASALDHVGKIIYVKKIFKSADCENDRQRYFWDQVELPFIYIIGRLFDGAGHAGALALAAIMRDQINNGEKLFCRFSVEGSTLKRDGNRLKTTIFRRCAVTVKPANRSANTGVLADPRPPPGVTAAKLKDLPTDEEIEKSLIIDPMYRHLGSFEMEYDPILKAEDMGGYNAPPSTLTNGAALMREDRALRQRWTAMAKAAYRDRPKDGTPFQRFLKFRMPDADPSFIDAFAAMADDYHLHKGEMNDTQVETAVLDYPESLGKAENVALEEPQVSPKVPGKEKEVPKKEIMKMLPEHAAKFKRVVGSSGRLVKKKADSYFDENTGVLHTHVGSFPMHIPKDQGYLDILNAPETSEPHDAAVKNWIHLNNALKAGKLPPEVAMHAALFSGMSPSAPVPLQEMAYSHLQDMMGNGLDPTKSGATSDALREEFINRTGPGGPLPEYMKEFWAGPGGAATRTQKGSGKQRGILYPGQKWYAVENYNRLHPYLNQLIDQHRGDVRSITEDLLQNKGAAQLHDAKAKRDAAKGIVTPDYETTTGKSAVKGYAPKTVRYLLGMLGGGNVHVPDTHFIRHTFGLPTDGEIKDQTEKHLGRKLREGPKTQEVGFTPNEHLKDILWDDSVAGHIGSQMDRYYAQHHPVVKHVAERHGLDPQDALFPAFWKHWLSIAPDERRRGIYNENNQEGTDHRVYWNMVNKIMQKYGLPNNGLIKADPEKPEVKPPFEEADSRFADMPPHIRSAMAMNTIHQLFGPTGAQFHYYHSIVPLLMQVARKRELYEEPEAEVAKFESMLVDMRKAANEATEELKKPLEVVFQGKRIQPGKGEFGVKPPSYPDFNFSILGKDHRHYFVVHPSRLPNFKAKDIAKIPRDRENFTYQVNDHPKDLDAKAIVDSAVHGLPDLNTSKEQHDLVHGLLLNNNPINAPAGAMTQDFLGVKNSEWRKNAQGKPVFVKAGTPGEAAHLGAESDSQQVRNEIAYHNLARDFFGMGMFVPTTAGFVHPQTQRLHAVVEGIPGAIHAHTEDHPGGFYPKVLKALHQTGLLHQAAFMNAILGNSDRHQGNFMLTKAPADGKAPLQLIDHGLSFIDPRDHYNMPVYLHDHLMHTNMEDQPVDRVGRMNAATKKVEYREERGPHQFKNIDRIRPEASRWLMSLNPKELASQMKLMGMKRDKIARTVENLKFFQSQAQAFGPTYSVNDAFLQGPGNSTNDPKKLQEEAARQHHEGHEA